MENGKLKIEKGDAVSLPNGWEVKQLGELCIIQLGKTPHRKTPRFWDKNKDSNNVWLSIADLKHGNEMFDSKEYISDLGAENVNITPKGTVMVSFKLTLGRVAFAGIDLLTNEAIASLIDLNDKVSKQFLFHYFTYFDWDKATQGDVKLKGKTLNKAKLKVLEIPIPPLGEQKRIVAKLDELFALIENGKLKVEKLLADAKELFQSQLNQIFSQKGEGWVEKKLGEVCEVIAGQSPKGKYYNDRGNGLPFYQGKKLFGEKSLKEPNVWTSVTTKESYLGDIIMSVRAPVGDVNFNYHEKICIGRGLAGIRAGETIKKDYLFYFLINHKNEITGNTGAVFNSINKSQISNISIPMVDLSQQKQIVNQLDELKSHTQALESKYQQELDALDELKKSILQKAFNGEL